MARLSDFGLRMPRELASETRAVEAVLRELQPGTRDIGEAVLGNLSPNRCAAKHQAIQQRQQREATARLARQTPWTTGEITSARDGNALEWRRVTGPCPSTR